MSSKSAENTIIKIIKQLTSKKNLSHSNDRLSCDLALLAGIFRIPPMISNKIVFSELFSNSILPTIQQVRDSVIEFITLDLLDNDESDVTTMEAGLKLWTNLLSSEEEVAKKSNEELVISREMNSLLKIIFDCLNSKGSKLGITDIDDKAKRLHVYETAACCGMSLLNVKSVAEMMTISQWHTLAWTLLHDNEETRKNIFAVFRTLLYVIIIFYYYSLLSLLHYRITVPLHPRFLVYPCLLASDEALSAVAKSSLKTAISRLRNTHESLCSRALLEDSEYFRLLAEQHIPETMVPFALHLLSYHPEFPESADIKVCYEHQF